MGKRTTRPAGRNDDPTLCCTLPIDIEKEKFEIIADVSVEDIPNRIQEGYITIKADTHVIDPKTGKRVINNQVKTGEGR